MKSTSTAESTTAWLFIVPSLLGFLGFFAVPAVRNVLISFTDWNMLSPAKQIGLKNYLALVEDRLFWHALGITVLYVLYNIPAQTIIALFLGTMMDRFARSIFVRGVLILPYLLPPVVVGLIWLWILNPILGVANVLLGHLGIPVQPFLGSAAQALPTIAGMNTWEYMGFNGLLFFAGLQTIPKTLYEAAWLDGASEWRIFWRISLPLLRPVTAFVIITSVIGSFQVFDVIAVTTKGGPVNATRVVVWYIFEQAFQQFKMGYGAAIATVLLVILGTVAIVQFRLFRTGSSDLG